MWCIILTDIDFSGLLVFIQGILSIYYKGRRFIAVLLVAL